MKRQLSYVLLGVFIVSLSSCGKREVPGNGNVENQARTVQSFKSVKISGNFLAQLKPGNSYGVNVITDSNLQSYVNTSVTDDVLSVDTPDKINLSPTKGVQVEITAPQFNKVEASGAVQLAIPQLKASQFELDVSGAVKASLGGTVENLTINASGACQIDTKNLVAKNVSIRSSGACAIMVNAEQQLDLKTSGSSKVMYYGSPSVQEKVEGASSVEKSEPSKSKPSTVTPSSSQSTPSQDSTTSLSDTKK